MILHWLLMEWFYQIAAQKKLSLLKLLVVAWCITDIHGRIIVQWKS